MLARPPPWLWVLLLLLLLPILVSCQVETQHLDTAVLYECVVGNLLSTSRRAAAAREQVPSVVPAAVVQAAAAALQTAGVKVHGQFGVQLSARMSPRQARSAAVRSACAYTFRSRPRVRGSARRLLQALQAGQVNSTQAVRAMGLDKVLAANPGLNGTGIRIGRKFGY